MPLSALRAICVTMLLFENGIVKFKTFNIEMDEMRNSAKQ